MEAVNNIAKNFEEAYEEYDQESPLLVQSENGTNPFFRGLIFAVPISFLMWGIIIWVFF